MCDTLCVLDDHGALFAKNSDRPPGELQLPVLQGGRVGGGTVRTQYLEIDDEGAARTLLSSPDWLWGAEHGINEHGVAVGNEKVDTVSGVARAPAALIGMDLVRLGLERGRSADAAVEVMTSLLERHGQGGVGDRVFDQAYDSSFIVADASSAWVLETAGRTWAAEPVPPGGAAVISNRLSIRTGWTRASADVGPGADFETWRDPAVDPGYADGRLAAGRACLGDEVAPGPTRPRHRPLTPGAVVAHLRDHGTGPWGGPGPAGASSDHRRFVPPPTEVGADGTGITVCMHVPGLMATTASMVARLPGPGTGPLRSWVALGSPCVSVYVPLLGLPDLPAGLDRLWRVGAELRARVEADGGELSGIRAVLDPLEAELWQEADGLVERPDRWRAFHSEAWGRLTDTLGRLTFIN